jgi:hypothetical protein
LRTWRRREYTYSPIQSISAKRFQQEFANNGPEH